MSFRPRWRATTWVLAAWSALFAIGAVVLGVVMATSEGRGVECTHRAYCVGATIPAWAVLALVFGAWLVGFLVLSLVWLMSRPRSGAGPVDGADERGHQGQGWSKTTWAIVGWSAFWIVLALVEIAHSHGACTHRGHCGTGHRRDAAIEVAIGSFLIWLPGFVVLSLISLAANRGRGDALPDAAGASGQRVEYSSAAGDPQIGSPPDGER